MTPQTSANAEVTGPLTNLGAASGFLDFGLTLRKYVNAGDEDTLWALEEGEVTHTHNICFNLNVTAPSNVTPLSFGLIIMQVVWTPA